MANQWLRLWHDMPTDPKWRTVAKASGQRISEVMAVYVHMLVCASNANERGRTQSFNCEDVASALDLETAQVEAIVNTMQGRVLDGDRLTGWEKRQVAREDGSAERAKAWREGKKAAKTAAPNAAERSRTQPERNRTPDTDEIREEQNQDPPPATQSAPPADAGSHPVAVAVKPSKADPWLTAEALEPDGIGPEVAAAWLAHRRTKKAKLTALAWSGFKREADKAGWPYEQAVLKAIARNWTGFEAAWVATERQQGPQTETAYARSMREKYEILCPSVAAKAPGARAKPIVLEAEDVASKLLG